MDRIHRLVFQHRRLLAAAFAGLATLAALGSVQRSVDGVTVLVARHDLTSGQVVAPSDVRPRVVPAAARPAHALSRASAVGRTVAGPMRRGETLTDYRVLAPDSLAGYGRGAVLTSVRVARSDGATGLRVGDRVDVVAVDPDGETDADVVARDVEVATLGATSDDEGVVLGVVTTEKGALALARSGLSSRFSVIRSSR